MTLLEAYKLICKQYQGFCLGGIEFKNYYGFSMVEVQGVLILVEKSTGAISLKPYWLIEDERIDSFERSDIGLN